MRCVRAARGQRCARIRRSPRRNYTRNAGLGTSIARLSATVRNASASCGTLPFSRITGHSAAYSRLRSTHADAPGTASETIASTGHAGSQAAQSMHVSWSMTSMFSPSRKQFTGQVTMQSMYLHRMQLSVTTYDTVLSLPLHIQNERNAWRFVEIFGWQADETQVVLRNRGHRRLDAVVVLRVDDETVTSGTIGIDSESLGDLFEFAVDKDHLTDARRPLILECSALEGHEHEDRRNHSHGGQVRDAVYRALRRLQPGQQIRAGVPGPVGAHDVADHTIVFCMSRYAVFDVFDFAGA